MKLHADEVDIDEKLVRKLLESQFPHWSSLRIKRVISDGTSNAVFRLRDTMSVRLPRIPTAGEHIQKEQEWLPKLAPHVSVAIPKVLGKGKSTDYYPFAWSVCSWLEGEDALTAKISDFDKVATDLARFLSELRTIDTTDAPLAIDYNVRGLPLVQRDPGVREAIETVGSMFAPKVLTKAWERALKAPDWDRPPVWIHGDMLPGNILITDNRVSAVIDFSGTCVGDPACDLMIAWSLLPPESREVLRSELDVDDATWERGRGHALSQALIFIPYYLHTHPKAVEQAKKTINNILAEQ